MSTKTQTREAWLESAIEAFRPRFEEVGMPLPEKIHVSVGFGAGSRRENNVILGQCWASCASEDKANHIFISPEIGDTARVLDVLIHELIHAADDCQSGHKGAFAEAATRLGLEGPMTSTKASVELAAEMICLAETLGQYPHGKLNTTTVRVKTPVGPDGRTIPTHSGPGKQGTRMLKVYCAESGYTARTTRKWLDLYGAPFCPCHSEVMAQG